MQYHLGTVMLVVAARAIPTWTHCHCNIRRLVRSVSSVTVSHKSPGSRATSRFGAACRSFGVESSSQGHNSTTGEPWLPESMRQQLETMRRRHREIVEHMTAGTLPVRDMGRMGKELGRLEAVLAKQAAVTEKAAETKDLEEVMRLSNSAGAEVDREMYDIAKEEYGECIVALESLQQELTGLLLPRDEEDSKNALLEVRSGSGGDEAAAFAKELFEMYRRFAELKGWHFDLLHCSTIDAGGYREAAASIHGEDVYGALKFENGVHRVQRVPSNSTRPHTSAASVVVMMEAEEVDVHMEPSELRFEAFRASGAGGQHVNTTESAVRVTHLPTGITVSIQDERSQHANREKALKVLRSRVFEVRREERARTEAAVRASAVGTGDRSERIRTYNFPQDRITDHRANVSQYGWEAMMRGDLLDTFIESLRERTRAEQLKAAGLADAYPPVHRR